MRERGSERKRNRKEKTELRYTVRVQSGGILWLIQTPLAAQLRMVEDKFTSNKLFVSHFAQLKELFNLIL